MRWGATVKPLSLYHSCLSMLRTSMLPHSRSVMGQTYKGVIRLLHSSPSSRRWAGSPSQSFTRSWNSLERFNRLSVPSTLAKEDVTCNTGRRPTYSYSPQSTDSDVNILKNFNESRDYDKTIMHFESLRPLSSSLPLSTLLQAMDQRLVIEYVKALLETRQFHRLGSESNHPTRDNPIVQSPNTMPEFRLRLDDTGTPIKVSVKEAGRGSWVTEIIKFGLSAIISLAALSIIIEGAAQNLPKGLGLGTKKVHAVTNVKTTFDDVKGCEEVKEELQEIIAYLTDPEKFTRLGAKLPKGILLSGPPGTGKTLLARAIAGEAKVPFIQASGSEFEEMFVGVGARRIRDLFTAARKMSPAIVFIDEIDAVGSRRVHKENTSVRMTLNQLLVELDGFEQNEGVVVICATNFPESLDTALTRPGRLDKTVVVPLPDLLGRLQILELYGSKVVLADDVDLSIVARRTAGMTGADLFNVINIAAVKSSAEEKAAISMEALEHAFDRVVVGLERRNPMSEEEKRMTAYHEGGHALVSIHTKGTDPVHKATIMPRGTALGIIPTDDRYQQKLCELEARLDVLMGGKAAESIIYGDENVTAGCASDLKAATTLARQMVMHFGMGVEKTRVPMFIDNDSYGALSDGIRKTADMAVQKLLDAAYSRATAVLQQHKEQLHSIAEALIEYETINIDEIKLILDGRACDIPSRRAAATKRKSERGQPRPRQKIITGIKNIALSDTIMIPPEHPSSSSNESNDET